MTTKPIAYRAPGSARYVSEDVAGTQQTLGPIRCGWPLELVQSGAGTSSDANTWDEQAAILLDVGLVVENATTPGDPLTGGTVVVEVNAAGQTVYGGSDAWIQVCPPFRWLNGAAPLNLVGVLGKAHILTKAGSTGSRIRITVTGNDQVTAYALVAPVVANPAC